MSALGKAFELNYEPREAFIPFHQRDRQFAVLVCHRRAGKTVACVAELILRALYSRRPRAKFAYIGPYRQQAKETAWEYLKDMSAGFIKGQPRESELRIRLPNDSTITIYGADNPNSFRGLYFDGVVVDEYGDIRPTLWNEVLLPTLLDRNGWAVFLGTVKGKNHFYRMYEKAQHDSEWFSIMLKASQSGILSNRAMRLAKREMTDESWQQEMECDWNAAVPGTYYAKIIAEIETKGQIGNFPHNPALPVYAAADIGFTDSTAFWFWQVDENGPVLIDYEQDSAQEMSFYFKMLRDKPYEYDSIYFPHDAKATSFQTGRTTVEQFIRQGFPVKPVSKQKRQHGIDAARMMLPRCRIDQTHCFAGIEALRAYRRKFDEKTQQYSDTPFHDWASDGADAFRYFALTTDSEFKPVDEFDDEPAELAAPNYTLDDLWAARDDEWRSKIIRL